MVIVHQIYKKPSITQRSEFHIISPWRNQTNPLMKGITSCCQEEAVIISGVATIPLPGRSKTSPGLPQVRQAGRGHARFCNLLTIKYHSYRSVETMAFFGCVSTLRFITHWQSTLLKTERGRVPPAGYLIWTGASLHTTIPTGRLRGFTTSLTASMEMKSLHIPLLPPKRFITDRIKSIKSWESNYP